MDDKDDLCSFVVCAGDGTETLLPGGIPDLELALVVVDFDGFELEVDADGCRVVLEVVVVAEAEEDAGFADALAADDDDFEQVVVFADHGGVAGEDYYYIMDGYYRGGKGGTGKIKIQIK